MIPILEFLHESVRFIVAGVIIGGLVGVVVAPVLQISGGTKHRYVKAFAASAACAVFVAFSLAYYVNSVPSIEHIAERHQINAPAQ
jgi:integral membrane sensor domain MASE1